MNTTVIIAALCVVPALAALLAPLAWRAFIRTTDKAIAESYEELRRQGITFDEQPHNPRSGGRP